MQRAAQTGISEKDRAFIDRRRKLIGYWRYAGAFMLIVILGFGAWLFLRSRFLIDPFELLARLEAGTVPEATLVIMAALVPVLFGGLLVLLTVLVLLMYAAIATEKRYLGIVESLNDARRAA